MKISINILFNDVNSLDYIASKDRRINELIRMWKEAVLPNLRYYHGICLEGLRKTTEISVRIAGLRAKI
jgi:hypothetical protein